LFASPLAVSLFPPLAINFLRPPSCGRQLFELKTGYNRGGLDRRPASSKTWPRPIGPHSPRTARNHGPKSQRDSTKVYSIGTIGTSGTRAYGAYYDEARDSFNFLPLTEIVRQSCDRHNKRISELQSTKPNIHLLDNSIVPYGSVRFKVICQVPPDVCTVAVAAIPSLQLPSVTSWTHDFR